MLTREVAMAIPTRYPRQFPECRTPAPDIPEISPYGSAGRGPRPGATAGGHGPGPQLLQLPAKHEHTAGGEHAAVPDHHADLRIVELGGRLAADLPDALLDGEHAVHPSVGVRQAAAVGVQRQRTTGGRVAV